jgi:flagellar basal-body rod protein FlgC
MTLLSAMSVAGSGMTAHSKRAQVHAVNIANLGTPGYKRQLPILNQAAGMPFSQIMQQVNSAGSAAELASFTDAGVAFSGTVDDPTPGQKVHMPWHPQADEKGYVEMSTANPLTDMSDALMANRMFEANLSVFGILKTMANKSVELGSGR